MQCVIGYRTLQRRVYNLQQRVRGFLGIIIKFKKIVLLNKQLYLLQIAGRSRRSDPSFLELFHTLGEFQAEPAA